MSVAIRLGALAALLVSACSLDISRKIGCNTVADCVPGYLCVSNHCVPSSGGGGTAGGGTGGNMSMIDGGPGDGRPPGMCSTSAVTTCPPADAGPRCEEIFCGGQLWQNVLMKSVLVSYRIADQGMFSASYRSAINAAAAAWTRVSAGFVTFRECTSCTGRFISVVPGDGDGIMNPEAPGEQFLPMPVMASSAGVSPHRIAHQWGHVVGLSHTYERADRDRYVRFDPDRWCPPGGPGLPPRCAAGPASPPLPAVTTGTFGAFDGKSKMNGLRSEGICGAEEPDEDSGEPTTGDVSALAELFFGATSGWSPFRPIGRSVSSTQPLDYQLATGVDPMGSPAIAEVESAYASPEIFVRGTDDRVYTTSRLNPLSSATAEWSGWISVANDVDADPAVVFAVNGNPETLFLAVRSRQDDHIHLRARRGGIWGNWTSLGAPPAGAASAPAIASQSPFTLAVLVRGGDGLIYRFACMDDAQDDCATSAANPNAWSALPAPPSGIFVGKPSAVWLHSNNNTGLAVAAVRDNREAMLITSVNNALTDWVSVANVNAELASDDQDPAVAITINSDPGDVTFFARNRQKLLISETRETKFFPIGGVLASPPGAVAIYHAPFRTDVAAIIVDQGRPGVWWRYHDGSYVPPCNYNLPGTCAQCGGP